MCMYLYIYIYIQCMCIYIYREREREICGYCLNRWVVFKVTIYICSRHNMPWLYHLQVH